MTPLDLKIKELMRQFLQRKINQSKHENGLQRIAAIIVKESEQEKFLDEMWLFINQELIKEQNGTKESSN